MKKIFFIITCLALLTCSIFALSAFATKSEEPINSEFPLAIELNVRWVDSYNNDSYSGNINSYIVDINITNIGEKSVADIRFYLQLFDEKGGMSSATTRNGGADFETIQPSESMTLSVPMNTSVDNVYAELYVFWVSYGFDGEWGNQYPLKGKDFESMLNESRYADFPKFSSVKV
ncbi:MAG: hypothetical protein FWF37_02735 [Chloroflexi bacterium]|nr:hypothetical protein [Chloroflexota bacterium]